MHPKPGERIFGVETEFGCLVVDPTLGDPEQAVEAIKDCVFHELRLGMIDLHARDDVFEPAMSGGFLINGARLYIDAVGSHLEYATAESRNLKDLVANDRAGQRMIVDALRELDLSDHISIYNNSVDHFGGHTFGCHENYLMRPNEDLLNSDLSLLFPFLVTRQIYAGVGRVGGHILTAGMGRPSYQEVAEHPIDYIWVSHVYGVLPDPDVHFQLSQRADHILKTVASRVRFNRAMINPKWEHFYSHEGMQRLHMLFGEANQNEYAYALKIGTTSIALRLLEEDRIPQRLRLSEPLIALREVSRDPSYRWMVDLDDGGSIGAVDLQREYLHLAQRYRGDTPDCDWVLDQWESTLDGLESDPMQMADRIDWVAKLQVVQSYMEEEGVSWDDDSLHSVDLEYHNIDPQRSLFYALQEMGQTRRILDDVAILDATTTPPADTRAHGRGKLIAKMLAKRNLRYYACDWNGVMLDRSRLVEMPDPFDSYDWVEA